MEPCEHRYLHHPVASIDWCRTCGAYRLRTIGAPTEWKLPTSAGAPPLSSDLGERIELHAYAEQSKAWRVDAARYGIPLSRWIYKMLDLAAKPRIPTSTETDG